MQWGQRSPEIFFWRQIVNARAQIRAYSPNFPKKTTELGYDEEFNLIARSLSASEASKPPWKANFNAFSAVPNEDALGDGLEALLRAQALAMLMIDFPFGDVLYEGYFREPQVGGRSEAVLAVEKLSSPLRRAVAGAHPRGTCGAGTADRPDPVAIKLPSGDVVVGKLKYDISGPEVDLYIKVNEDLLEKGGIFIDTSKCVQLVVVNDEQHGVLIAAVNQPAFGESIPDFNTFDGSGVDFNAEEAVRNSLAVGKVLYLAEQQERNGGPGSLGNFTFDSTEGKARCTISTAGDFGHIVSALMDATRSRFSEKNLELRMNFVRPDQQNTSTELFFRFEDVGGVSGGEQRRVLYRERNSSNREKTTVYNGKSVQLGVVAGRDRLRLGMQVLKKREAAGGDELKIPNEWEQCDLSFTQKIELILRAVPKELRPKTDDNEYAAMIEALETAGYMD